MKTLMKSFKIVLYITMVISIYTIFALLISRHAKADEYDYNKQLQQLNQNTTDSINQQIYLNQIRSIQQHQQQIEEQRFYKQQQQQQQQFNRLDNFGIYHYPNK